MSSSTTAAPARSLVIKTTSGVDRPEAANQALTVAAAAVAAGAEVSLWLTGESAWFAVPGRVAELALEHAAPAADLLDAVLAAGSVTLCTQCAARRDLGPDDVLPGIRIAGAAVFAEEILRPGAQALVY
ncbi:DsrE family protein [Isoptericola sp. 4D.3]|uniref:DsrE family protein n=1 Tax=Isoptericola peretonis TaxID=2918523 RepID=A0ABT0J6U3_9MICO|nr:DsrE family protein [Isoptericola sp. 4D.3]